MKKLMIAACAAAMAMGAQAATEQWTLSASANTKGVLTYTVKDGYKATAVSGTSENLVGEGLSVYYIGSQAFSTGTFAEQNTLVNAFLQSLRAGKSMTEAVSDNKMTLLATSTTDKDSYVTAVNNVAVDTSWYSTSTFGVLIAIMTEKEDFVYLSPKNVNKASLIIPNAVQNSTTLRDNNGTVAYSGYNSGWYSTAPEPTSGLLMLVGGMLLGLRRKRR